MIKRLSNLLAPFVVLGLIFSISFAKDKPDERSKFMPVEEIRPGMKGYGLTVFEGTKVERFGVEVVDVLKKAMPKQDIILVKLSGHGLEESGIYQGMSGSPVFIDDRLIGALAYGWAYTKVSIAGVTPIENMLEVMERPVAKPIDVAANDANDGVKYKDGRIIPLTTPVMVSGIPAAVMDDLSDFLDDYNMNPIQGGGAQEGVSTGPFRPGGAMGVTLTRGDISMHAIGTVTWVEGSRVLAFGHPFLNGGEIRFPVTGAKVLALLPRLSISTKMGLATAEAGGLVQDRQACVVADTDYRASMVPFRITVINEKTGKEENFNIEMAWETRFTSRLMDTLLRAALVYAEAHAGENTAETVVEAKFEGYPPVTLENTYFNGRGPFNKAMLEPVRRMLYNPFEDVRLESLKVRARITPDIRIAVIKRLWMEEDEIPPGGVGHVHVVLEPFGGEETERVVEVRISGNAAPGSRVMVGAAGGMSVIPPAARPVDFKGVMRFLESLYKATDLVVVQQTGTTGASIEGEVMPDLPPAALRMLGAPNVTGPIIRGDFGMTPVSTGWVILGKAVLNVRVAK